MWTSTWLSLHPVVYGFRRGQEGGRLSRIPASRLVAKLRCPIEPPHSLGRVERKGHPEVSQLAEQNFRPMHFCPGRYLLELLRLISNERKLEDERLQAALDGVAAQVLCVEGVLLPEQSLRGGQSLSRGLLEISARCWRHEPTPDWAAFLLKIIVPSSARVGNSITELRLACLTRPCESLHWTGEPRSRSSHVVDRARRPLFASAPTVQDPYNANRPNIDTDLRKPPPLPDLPPVEAPSAGFVVQLFVIPAVVVAVVILVWLLFGKLAGGERDPVEYVRRLRQASGDWRSAFELASLIQNDAKLASDPRLLGELTDLLSAELKTNDNAELKVYLIKTIGAFQTLDATLGDNRKVDPIEPLTTVPRAGSRFGGPDGSGGKPGKACRPARRQARRSAGRRGADSGCLWRRPRGASGCRLRPGLLRRRGGAAGSAGTASDR